MTRALALALALLCAAAHLAGAKPKATDLRRADRLLREGNAEYARKNYEQAIRAYQEAYDLTGAPGFLFNIAQVHRVAGNCSEAIAHYERYLAADPKTTLRPRVEAFIAEMWRCVEARRKTEPVARRDGSNHEPPAEAAPPPPPPARAERSPPGASPLTLQSQRDAPRPSAWRWVGLATAGAGALALGGGVVLGLDARSEANRTEDFAGEWTPEDEARENAAERRSRNATILITAGAVALVGGVSLYLLTRRPPEVSASAAGRGGAMSWRF